MSFWTDKVVFLTGASSGIGSVFAIEVARRGAIVGLLARREPQLQAVAEKIRDIGGIARFFVCDVTDEKGVSDAANSLREEFGRIDILVANAGIGGNNRKTREIRSDAVTKVISVNLIGAANAVSAVLPAMVELGSGHLVAVSSLAGFRGLPKSAAYSASKAGMTAFFESLRLDFKHKGVHVTIIQPGFIRTPLTSGRKNKLPFLMEVEDGVKKMITAIEKKRRFAAFPWQLATVVRLARVLPGWLYDGIAGRANYRE